MLYFQILKTAFDSVDHTMLQEKLRACLQNPSVTPFFQPYLSDRSQFGHANGKMLAVGTIQSAVPQSSTQWPLLFRIDKSDLPLHLQEKKVKNSLFVGEAPLDISGQSVNEIEVRNI